MGTYFDINGTAMIYINTNPSIRNAKTKKEADKAIDKHCQDLVARFKDKLQELTKQNPDIFDEISFEGFYPLGLDIHCFQNHAHGPSTDLDNIENGKRIHIHDTATLTINGTIETDYYEEHRQLLIDAFQQLFIDTANQPYSQYALFRLNLITMWESEQHAIILDPYHNILTTPLIENY
jgi:hypothetical protein